MSVASRIYTSSLNLKEKHVESNRRALDFEFKKGETLYIFPDKSKLLFYMGCSGKPIGISLISDGNCGTSIPTVV